ncbi:hypothetical protein TNCV_3841391 [Trichonephila clavipes]|nr:hypothetical protein TNCV_3841391 [Trichonephila clavipes]
MSPKGLITSRLTGVGSLLPPVYSEAWFKGNAKVSSGYHFSPYRMLHTANVWVVDGTWQRRGYSSMNGCVAALSVDTGKVVDIEIMSSYCPTCRKISKMPRSIEVETLQQITRAIAIFKVLR